MGMGHVEDHASVPSNQHLLEVLKRGCASEVSNEKLSAWLTDSDMTQRFQHLQSRVNQPEPLSSSKMMNFLVQYCHASEDEIKKALKLFFTNDENMDDMGLHSIESFRLFFYEERVHLYKCIQEMIRITDDQNVNHPYHQAVFQVIIKLHQNGIFNQLMEKYKYLQQHPTSRKSLDLSFLQIREEESLGRFLHQQIYDNVLHHVKEQVELLETMLIFLYTHIYETGNAARTLELLQLFREHHFGLADLQSSASFLPQIQNDPLIQSFYDRAPALCISILLSSLQLEELLSAAGGQSTLGNHALFASCRNLETQDPTVMIQAAERAVEPLHQYIMGPFLEAAQASKTNAPQSNLPHGLFLLAWSCVLKCMHSIVPSFLCSEDQSNELAVTANAMGALPFCVHMMNILQRQDCAENVLPLNQYERYYKFGLSSSCWNLPQDQSMEVQDSKEDEAQDSHMILYQSIVKEFWVGLLSVFPQLLSPDGLSVKSITLLSTITSQIISNESDLAQLMFQPEHVFGQVLSLSRSIFPLYFMPFVQLIKAAVGQSAASAQRVFEYLAEPHSFTRVCTNECALLISPDERHCTAVQVLDYREEGIVIPMGTKGKILNQTIQNGNAQHWIIEWQNVHLSTWTVLISKLECFVQQQPQNVLHQWYDTVEQVHLVVELLMDIGMLCPLNFCSQLSTHVFGSQHMIQWCLRNECPNLIPTFLHNRVSRHELAQYQQFPHTCPVENFISERDEQLEFLQVLRRSELSVASPLFGSGRHDRMQSLCHVFLKLFSTLSSTMETYQSICAQEAVEVVVEDQMMQWLNDLSVQSLVLMTVFGHERDRAGKRTLFSSTLEHLETTFFPQVAHFHQFTELPQQTYPQTLLLIQLITESLVYRFQCSLSRAHDRRCPVSYFFDHSGEHFTVSSLHQVLVSEFQYMNCSQASLQYWFQQYPAEILSGQQLYEFILSHQAKSPSALPLPVELQQFFQFATAPASNVVERDPGFWTHCIEFVFRICSNHSQWTFVHEIEPFYFRRMFLKFVRWCDYISSFECDFFPTQESIQSKILNDSMLHRLVVSSIENLVISRPSSSLISSMEDKRKSIHTGRMTLQITQDVQSQKSQQLQLTAKADASSLSKEKDMHLISDTLADFPEIIVQVIGESFALLYDLLMCEIPFTAERPSLIQSKIQFFTSSAATFSNGQYSILNLVLSLFASMNTNNELNQISIDWMKKNIDILIGGMYVFNLQNENQKNEGYPFTALHFIGFLSHDSNFHSQFANLILSSSASITYSTRARALDFVRMAVECQASFASAFFSPSLLSMEKLSTFLSQSGVNSEDPSTIEFQVSIAAFFVDCWQGASRGKAKHLLFVHDLRHRGSFWDNLIQPLLDPVPSTSGSSRACYQVLLRALVLRILSYEWHHFASLPATAKNDDEEDQEDDQTHHHLLSIMETLKQSKAFTHWISEYLHLDFKSTTLDQLHQKYRAYFQSEFAPVNPFTSRSGRQSWIACCRPSSSSGGFLSFTFPTSSESTMARTMLPILPYGSNFVWKIPYSESALRHDICQWNVQWSVMDAQVQLIVAWKDFMEITLLQTGTTHPENQTRHSTLQRIGMNHGTKRRWPLQLPSSPIVKFSNGSKSSKASTHSESLPSQFQGDRTSFHLMVILAQALARSDAPSSCLLSFYRVAKIGEICSSMVHHHLCVVVSKTQNPKLSACRLRTMSIKRLDVDLALEVLQCLLHTCEYWFVNSRPLGLVYQPNQEDWTELEIEFRVSILSSIMLLLGHCGKASDEQEGKEEPQMSKVIPGLYQRLCQVNLDTFQWSAALAEKQLKHEEKQDQLQHLCISLFTSVLPYVLSKNNNQELSKSQLFEFIQPFVQYYEERVVKQNQVMIQSMGMLLPLFRAFVQHPASAECFISTCSGLRHLLDTKWSIHQHQLFFQAHDHDVLFRGYDAPSSKERTEEHLVWCVYLSLWSQVCHVCVNLRTSTDVIEPLLRAFVHQYKSVMQANLTPTCLTLASLDERIRVLELVWALGQTSILALPQEQAWLQQLILTYVRDGVYILGRPVLQSLAFPISRTEEHMTAATRRPVVAFDSDSGVGQMIAFCTRRRGLARGGGGGGHGDSTAGHQPDNQLQLRHSCPFLTTVERSFCQLIQSTPSLESTYIRIHGTEVYDEEAAMPIVDFVSASSVASTSRLALGHLQLLLDWALDYLEQRQDPQQRSPPAAAQGQPTTSFFVCQVIRHTMHLMTLNWTLHVRRYVHARDVKDELFVKWTTHMSRLKALALEFPTLEFPFLERCHAHIEHESRRG